MRFRRGLVIMAHSRKVGEFARLERERVFFFPLAFNPHLQTEIISGRRLQGQTINASVLRLLRPGLQAQRFHKTVSKSNVSQPCFFEIDAQREVVKFGPVSAIFPCDAT